MRVHPTLRPRFLLGVAGIPGRSGVYPIKRRKQTMTRVPASAVSLLILLVRPLPGASQQYAPLDDALRGSPSGICVLLGAGDGSAAARAAEGGRRLVHVLEADEARIRAARALLVSRGL